MTVVPSDHPSLLSGLLPWFGLCAKYDAMHVTGFCRSFHRGVDVGNLGSVRGNLANQMREKVHDFKSCTEVAETCWNYMISQFENRFR
jgi:hypothetical protein